MEQQTDSDELTERAEKTAEFIRDAVSGWNVTAKEHHRKDITVFIVYSDEDHVTTNGFAKASVINTVLSEVPALEVRCTEEESMAVRFTYKNE